MKVYMLHNKLDDTYMKNNKWITLPHWVDITSEDIWLFRTKNLDDNKTQDGIWSNLRRQLKRFIEGIASDETTKQRGGNFKYLSNSNAPKMRIFQYLHQEMHSMFHGDFMPFYIGSTSSYGPRYNWNKKRTDNLLALAIEQFEIVEIDIFDGRRKVHNILDFCPQKMTKLTTRCKLLKQNGLPPVL